MKKIFKRVIWVIAAAVLAGGFTLQAREPSSPDQGQEAAAPLVSKIVIEGNIRLGEDEILKEIPFRAGDLFDSAAAAGAVPRLYGLEKLEDISVYTEEDEEGNIIVIYSVEEKPLIDSLEFKGNEALSSRRLRRELDISAGDFYDEFKLDAQARALERFYRERGYAAVKVDSYVSPLSEDNKVSLTFHVVEGKKVNVEKINILGVLEGDYKKIRDMIELKKGDPYREQPLEEGIEKIREYYLNSGYLHAEVEGPSVTFDPAGEKMFITLFITESFRYKVGEINISGNQLYTDSQIKSALSLREGRLYSDEDLSSSIGAIQELYAEIGHVSSGVFPRHDFNRPEREVDLMLEIHEGPEVSVRDVYISGNRVTRDYVIRRHITVAEGEPFNLGEIRRTQERIFRLGFFQDVMLELSPTEKEDEIDIVFVVEEQKTGMASIGAGYSSQEGVMGTLQVSQENFLGRGQRISAMWEFGRRIQNYRLSFSEPYLFRTPTPFSASLYNTVRRRRYFTGHDYKERRRGGSISLGRHFTDIFTGRMRYSLEEVKIYEVDSRIEDDVKEETRVTSSITPSISFDTRDYPFDPRTGYNLRFSNQIAGGIVGGDVNFSKFESKKTYFPPLYKNIVGVLNLELGSAFAYGDTDAVPVYERFYVGGSESIRGYEYYEIEGNHKAVFNAEIKFPIVRDRRQTILQGAIFYDVGGAWSELDEARMNFGENDLRRGYGAGIRFKTMAFPIRIDWGFGIDRPDRGGRWYFTMGDIF